MKIKTVTAKRILTRQKGGFLTEGPHPFTHTLSWAVGCGFGKTYCGKYCYAQMLPNWTYNRSEDDEWGGAIVIKENAPQLLATTLSKSAKRPTLRIFMSSVTDPYQPLERRFRLTRQCLDVFVQYPDIDLLVIQTRSPLVADDFDHLAAIPYAVLSMTIETDRSDLPYGPNQAMIEKRFEAVTAAVKAGVRAQITVSPCLPYTDAFAQRLMDTGVERIVVDTFVAGDGSNGERTADSPFADVVDYNWRDNDPARQLFDTLNSSNINVGWSAQGFGGIPPRTTTSQLLLL